MSLEQKICLAVIVLWGSLGWMMAILAWGTIQKLREINVSLAERKPPP